MTRVSYHFIRGDNPKKFASILVNFMGKVLELSFISHFSRICSFHYAFILIAMVERRFKSCIFLIDPKIIMFLERNYFVSHNLWPLYFLTVIQLKYLYRCLYFSKIIWCDLLFPNGMKRSNHNVNRTVDLNFMEQ